MSDFFDNIGNNASNWFDNQVQQFNNSTGNIFGMGNSTSSSPSTQPVAPASNYNFGQMAVQPPQAAAGNNLLNGYNQQQQQNQPVAPQPTYNFGQMTAQPPQVAAGNNLLNGYNQQQNQPVAPNLSSPTAAIVSAQQQSQPAPVATPPQQNQPVATPQQNQPVAPPPTAPVAAPQQTQPGIQPFQAPATGTGAELPSLQNQQNIDALMNPNASQQDLAALAYHPDTEPGAAKLAKQRLAATENFSMQAPQKMAMIKASMAGDPVATKEFTEDVKKAAEEPDKGSITKTLLAYLFHDQEGVRGELGKMGIGTSTAKMDLGNGRSGYVTRDYKGNIYSGYDSDGNNLTNQELANATLGMQKSRQDKAQEAAVAAGKAFDSKILNSGYTPKPGEREAAMNRAYSDALAVSQNGFVPSGETAGTPAVKGSAGYQGNLGNNSGASGNYLSTIAKGESGDTPGKGYHDQSKSSAYGKYGITADTYAQIQKSDPYFAGKDITSLSEADQDRAATVLTSNNSHALAAAGIPVNDSTLSAAHFLGAQGLQDYLKDGTISPAAAKANGGYANAKMLVDKRLGSGAGGATGNTLEDRIHDDIESMRVQRPDDTYDTLKKRRDSLSSIDTDAVISDAKAVAQYKQDVSKLGRGTQYRSLVDKYARQFNPDYDGKEYAAKSAIVKDFASGAAAKNVDAYKTVTYHLGDMTPMITDLNNGKLLPANQILNKISRLTGNPNITNFKLAGQVVGDEMVKTMVGSGGGTLADREEVRHIFSDINSPEQLQGAIKTAQRLMVDKMDVLRSRYERTGNKDWDENIIGSDSNGDNIRQIRDQIHQEREQLRSGSGTPTKPIALSNDDTGIKLWNNAPSGTIFTTPDGKRKVKP